MRKISFLAEIDSSKAQKELDRLNRKIASTTEQLERAQEKRSGIEEQLEGAKNAADGARVKLRELSDEYRRLSAEMYGARQAGKSTDALAAKRNAVWEEYREQEAAIRAADRSVQRLTKEYARADAQCNSITRTLERQQNAAGELERKLAKAYRSERIRGAIDGLKDRVRSVFSIGTAKGVAEKVTGGFKAGLKTIMKYALGIRGLFALFKRLRGAVTEGVNNLVKQDSRLNSSLSAMKSGLSTVKNALGAAFAPVLTAIAPLVTKLCSMLTDAANAVARFFAILGGQSSYKKAIQVQEDYAASLESTGSAAKEAAGYLSGLDEIATYNDGSSSGGGGGGSSSAAFAEEAVDAAGSWAEQVKQAIEAGDWRGAGKLFASKMNSVIENFNAAKSAKKISETIKGSIEAAIGFVEEVDWKQLGNKVAEFIKNIDWSGIISDMFELIGAALGGLGGFVWGLLEGALTDVYSYFKKYIDEWIERLGGADAEPADIGFAIVCGLIEGLWNGIKNIGKWIVDNIFKPIWDGIRSAFDIHSPSRKMEELGILIIEGVVNGLKKIGELLKKWWDEHIAPWFTRERWQKLGTDAKAWLTEKLDFSGIKETIGPWYTSKIAPWFTKDKWEKLGSDAKQWLSGKLDFSGIKDGISGWYKNKVEPYFAAAKWSNLGTTAKNAIEGKIALTKDAVKSWYETKVAKFFTKSTWENLGTTAKNAIEGKISLTKDAAKSWYDSKISPYFTAAKWQQLGSTAKDALENKVAITVDTAKSWYDQKIAPVFAASKWRTLATDAINALKNNLSMGGTDPLSTWYATYVSPLFSASKWRGLATDAISSLKNAFGLGSWSPISEWWNDKVSPWFTWDKWKKLGTDAISAIKNGLSSLTLPKFRFEWTTSYKEFSVLGQKIGMNIPWPKLSFYSRGGIINGATYLGNGRVAGEDGREAIIPLERHTEWIEMVANALADILIDRLGTLMQRIPMPAVASGTLIPPRITVDLPGLDALRGDLAEIKALMNRERGGSYEFIAQLNRRTIFDEMIAEARLRRSTTGKNPLLDL